MIAGREPPVLGVCVCRLWVTADAVQPMRRAIWSHLLGPLEQLATGIGEDELWCTAGTV